MTEEQFWHSNPRIWQVWGEAHKGIVNEQNMLNYYSGMYTLRSLQMALEGAFSKHPKLKYFDEPLRIYELTEEEKKAQQKEELEKFMSWANHVKEDYSK